HRQHAHHVVESVQRLPHALGQHRGGDPGGAARRHALSHPVPRRPAAVRHHLPRQHRGRAGAATAARAVFAPLMSAASLFGDHRRRSAAMGQALTWLCGGALAFNLLLVIAIMVLMAVNGLSYFWQKDLVLLELKDGRKLLGEIWEVEKVAAAPGQPALDRLRIKVGNRDVGGLDFAWIDEKDVAGRSRPPGAVLLERLEWGNF